MSLYSQYIKEREDKEIIETEKGYLTFKLYENEVYIEDLFVLKEFRKDGVASEMADRVAEIAKSKGIKLMSGSVCVGTNGDTTSLKVLLAYGFRLHSIQGNMIYMSKEL